MFTLKDHPFAVEAFFDTSLVLTYAVPKDQLKPLIPECLELDMFQNKWAFVAVALVSVKDLRLRGFPKFMGNDFILTGMRIFVRYTNNLGKRLRGLYILKSETNKNSMAVPGNIFTHYKYSVTDIDFIINNDNIKVSSLNSGIDLEVSINEENIPLPQGSPFADWKEARRYAGPLPFTFSYKKAAKQVLIVEGVREDWTPKPVHVLKANIDFIEQQQFHCAVLANAFVVQNIPYHWKKGKTETWKG